nr:uncharacterized protein CI109_006569 [Kwoniella shandongensis]KAA5525107.1 hypothetical protein CI109_006569 [Kwoniella shandongensis]
MSSRHTKRQYSAGIKIEESEDWLSLDQHYKPEDSASGFDDSSVEIKREYSPSCELEDIPMYYH